MKSQDETLEDWCRALLQALELEDVEVDVNEVLALAGVAAHSGQATDAVSMQAAMGVARKLAKDYAANEASGA